MWVTLVYFPSDVVMLRTNAIALIQYQSVIMFTPEVTNLDFWRGGICLKVIIFFRKFQTNLNRTCMELFPTFSMIPNPKDFLLCSQWDSRSSFLSIHVDANFGYQKYIYKTYPQHHLTNFFRKKRKLKRYNNHPIFEEYKRFVFKK